MNEKSAFYKCEICGTIVEVVHEGAGELSCCGKPVKKMVKNTVEPDMGEYHLPVIEKNDKYQQIKVGKSPHPMTPEHHIEFIEVYSKCGKKISRKYLTPDETPEIKVPACFDTGRAAAYCNIHGLWETTMD